MEDINNDFEVTTFEVPDIPQWEGRLNPEAHMHYGLLSLQKMLVHEDPKIGFMQYAAQVRHLEGIARAAKKLDQDYQEAVKKYEEKVKTDNPTAPEHIKLFYVAQYRLELILGAFFNSQPLKSSGKV